MFDITEIIFSQATILKDDLNWKYVSGIGMSKDETHFDQYV